MENKRRRLDEDAPVLCEHCSVPSTTTRVIHGISLQASSPPPHSNVSAKRAHRKWALDYVIQHPAKTPALFYLDDKLPTVAADWTYLTDDVLQTGRFKPHQLFSPNIKREVVIDLQQRGLVNVDHTCACRFMRYADTIRDMYGWMVLAFIDVWGGYETGARPLLELSLSLRLLEPTAGCIVKFAASYRYARSQGSSVVATYVKVEWLCDDVGLQINMIEPPADLPVSYNTMQVHGWHMMREPAAVSTSSAMGPSEVDRGASGHEFLHSEEQHIDQISPYDVFIHRLRELERNPLLKFNKIVEIMKKELHAEWKMIHPLEEANFSESFQNKMI
jgi:hypothetical protein